MSRLTPDLSNLPGVIGLSGHSQSGKDTIADYLVEVHGYRKAAFADALRQLAALADPPIEIYGQHSLTYSDLIEIHGYDEARRQYPEIRAFLQRLGHGARAVLGDEVWVDALHRETVNVPYLVIPDVRYVNEADYVQGSLGWLWRVTRPGVGPANAHESKTEAALRDAKVTFDEEIVNDGDVPALYATVERALHRAARYA